MQVSESGAHLWIATWMQTHGVELWGAADLREFSTPTDANGRSFPLAISWAVPMNPQIMVSIAQGPNQAYADEYARANHRINALGQMLADALRGRGFCATALAASERVDRRNFKGEFPHKTAATRAGLGWIGRHCQLITRRFGSWIRLGTVFSNMGISPGMPAERSFCGRCMRCVEACPARALTGNAWYPGILREKILDVEACDRWKRANYLAYHNGQNCGICSSVCPYGRKVLTRPGKSKYRKAPARGDRKGR